MTRPIGPVEARAPVAAPTETTAQSGPSAAGGAASTASTIEPARPLAAHEPKEFCDRVTALFKDLIDMVSSIVFPFFNWVRGLVAKGERTPVPEAGVNPSPVPPGPSTERNLASLQVFRGCLESGSRRGDVQVYGSHRDQVLSSFYQGLTNELQEQIKLTMLNIARLYDSHIPHDHQEALDWVDRVIRGEVDVVGYARTFDGNLNQESLLSEAVGDVIKAVAIGAGRYRLAGGLEAGNPEFERVVYSAIDYFDRRLPVGVQEAIGLKMWEFAQQDSNPNRPPVPAIQQREERARWAITILNHRPFGSAVAGHDERGVMAPIVYYSGTLRDGNNIFFRAIDAVIAEGGENAVHARRLLDRIEFY